jgi:transposase
MVIEDMAQGYSLAAFAGKIGVGRDTIYRWVREHSAFSDAVNRASMGRQRAFESRLLTAEKGAQAAAAIFGLKNVAPEDWKEVREVKHDHTHALHRLTDAQLYDIAARKAGQGNVIDGEAVRVETD